MKNLSLRFKYDYFQPEFLFKTDSAQVETVNTPEFDGNVFYIYCQTERLKTNFKRAIQITKSRNNTDRIQKQLF